jgi:hypothetical protein
MKLYFFLLIAVALFGCSKKVDTVSETVGPTYNATLKLHLVHYEFVNGAQTSTAVQNATVKLYETKQNALNDADAKFTQVTNAGGDATFDALQKPKYYVFITHALYGSKLDSVDTPNNTFFTWEETI